MPSFTTTAALALPLAKLASAHGYVSGIKVNGGDWIDGTNPNWYYQPAGTAIDTPGWLALNQDNGFVAPDAYTSTDIACHKSAKPASTYIDANSGDTLTLFWNTWPDTHKGPMLNYLAQCNGECTNETAGDLSFTKFQQAGYDSGVWETDTMIAQNFSTDVVIPSALEPGNYVLRHEIIALHSAGNEDGAQNYPQCLNVKIGTGGSTALPTGEPAVDFYTPTDPGILFDIYTTFTSYPIPGPDVWTA
ncbi:lytic polysaccharide monooxygenase [Xylaria sp. CBS 124048]|nr:lytic polysaccharide monooxygenase [Xylaria sp. CBS 124048]